MQVEPDAKIMQSHFGGQTSLKSSQVMRTFPSQAERVQQLVIHGLNDLSQTGQPATQGFGPALPSAALMWRGDQIDLVPLSPLTPGSLPCKPFIGHIRPLGGQTGTGKAWRGALTGSKQRGGQMLDVRARACKAKASNHSLGSHTQQHMEAFVPADAITPANIRLTRQPAQATPLRITGHGSRAIEHFIGRALRLQKLHQEQCKGRDRISVFSLQPIELAAIWQLRKRFSQVMVRIAVKGSFALKLHPLSKQGQRDHLTSAQRPLRAWSWHLWLKLRPAKIIYHDVQCNQEHIQIDHQRAPFLVNWFDKLTIRSGSLPFQVLSISHQTLKMRTIKI